MLACGSTFHAPGARETDWCCANSFVYAVRGFANKTGTAVVPLSNERKLAAAIVAAGRLEGLRW